MAAGYSIHLGVNYVDVNHYHGTFQLPFCANDAAAMAILAEDRGFVVAGVFINQEATSRRLLSFLEALACELQNGDMLLVTFSGHGTSVKDRDGDEKDGRDEAWVLFDRQLVDDELGRAWAAFKKGVRIVVVADCCHAGTSIKDPGTAFPGATPFLLPQIEKDPTDMLPKNEQELLQLPAGDIKAEVLLLAACGDKQLARSGSKTGSELSLFTDELLTVYHKKTFDKTYQGLVNAINRQIPANYFQKPLVCSINPGILLKQYPFTISLHHH